MAFFDEPRPRRTFGAASARGATASLRASPATFVVSVALSAIFMALAVAVAVATNEAAHRLRAAVERTEVTVYLRPEVTRDEATAVVARIEAMPFVGAARLRTKEDAMAALAGAALPTLPLGANPLPDAVVVTLRIPIDDGTPLVDRFETARQSLATVPSADSAVFDNAWVVRLAGWRSGLRAHTDRILVITAALLAVVIFGVGFLAGRAYRGATRDDDEAPAAGASALAVVGSLAALLSVAATVGFAALAVRALGLALPTMQPYGVLAGLMGTPWVPQIVCGAALIGLVAHAVSARKR